MVGRSEADDISPEYDAETSKQANGLDNGKLMALSAELSHGVAHRWMETWLLELSDYLEAFRSMEMLWPR